MWWEDFKVGTTLTTSSIDEIHRFVEESVVKGGSVQDLDRAADHLITLFETVDLHFAVDETDEEGVSITTAMGAILLLPGADRVLWAPHLSAIALLMAERLVAYRQDTNPSDAQTARLKRFIRGLRGFVLQDGSGLTDLAELRWTLLVERIGKARQNLTDPKWHKSLLRASASPLAQMASFGTAINDDLRKHRKARASDTALKIFELQEREVVTLSGLRRKLERLIDKLDPSEGQMSLHIRSLNHLFMAKTYFAVAPEIEVVLQAKSGERHQAILLLQKKFEYLALVEVSTMLKNASACYRKILSIIESTKGLQSRCMAMLEQMSELYWLQRRTLNQPHAHAKVDGTRFMMFARAVSNVSEDSDPMWSPSILKLDEMVSTERVTADALELMYDAILAFRYVSARARPWHSVGTLVSVTHGPKRSPRHPSPATSDHSSGNESLTSVLPLKDAAETRDKPGSGGDEDVRFLVTSSLHPAVIAQREVVRSLLRDVQQAAAKVDRTVALQIASVASLGLFVDLVLTPFLAPLLVQWTNIETLYLKPMSRELEDKHLLVGAKDFLKDSAIKRLEPSSSSNVGTSVSSSGVLVLQGLKIVRLFMQIGAAFVAQKVFNESYVRKVFSEGRDPPLLTGMLFLMLSIDATAHLMIVLILVLASFAFKTDSNTFLIDDIFLADVLTEFAMSSLVLILLGMMVADMMRRKRYFQYPDQGQVVSTAYRSALMYICVVNFVIPFSMLVS